MNQPPADHPTEPAPTPGNPAPASADETGKAELRPDERPLPSPGDDGVIARVRRRTSVAASLPMTAGLLLALTGWWWPGWFAGRSGFFIGGLAVAVLLLAAGALVRRARLWARAVDEAAIWSRGCLDGAISVRAVPAGWVKAACGAPVSLHAGRGSVPMVRRERRFASQVLPLKTVYGPLSAGQALVVHARADGAMLVRGDQIQALVLQSRGPILIGRLDDGAVFAADRWAAGTS